MASHSRKNRKQQLKDLERKSKEIEALRRTRNAILSSGAYSRRAWLEQKKRIHFGHPDIKDEEEIVDGTWEMQHERAEELAIAVKTLMTEEVRAKLRKRKMEMFRCPVCGKYRGLNKHGHEVGSYVEPTLERQVYVEDDDGFKTEEEFRREL